MIIPAQAYVFYEEHRESCFNNTNERLYEKWCNHMRRCENCSDWYMGKEAENAGAKINQFPCVHTAYNSRFDCKIHSDPFNCPDVLIVKDGKSFGIPIKDGGTSYSKIGYCPWCGIKL